jgi:hypothetical protein
VPTGADLHVSPRSLAEKRRVIVMGGETKGSMQIGLEAVRVRLHVAHRRVHLLIHGLVDHQIERCGDRVHHQRLDDVAELGLELLVRTICDD